MPERAEQVRVILTKRVAVLECRGAKNAKAFTFIYVGWIKRSESNNFNIAEFIVNDTEHSEEVYIKRAAVIQSVLIQSTIKLNTMTIFMKNKISIFSLHTFAFFAPLR